MENNNELSDEQYWKRAIKNHLTAFIVMIIVGIGAILSAITVLFWFIQTSPIGLQGTATFNQWSLDWIVGFFILLILWELLFVGIPVVLFFGVGGYIFWKRLPEEEKQEYKAREKKHTARKTGGGGGGFSLFMFIAYCIYMGIQGYYFAPFGSQPYSFWIASWFLTLMWIVIVLGIPACIILIIVYFTVWRKKSE
jgi:MFS family permease